MILIHIITKGVKNMNRYELVNDSYIYDYLFAK